MTQAPSTELLTTAEVMAWLRIRRAALDALIADGLPVIRLTVRTFRYDRAAVAAWLDSRWSAPAADSEAVA